MCRALRTASWESDAHDDILEQSFLPNQERSRNKMQKTSDWGEKEREKLDASYSLPRLNRVIFFSVYYFHQTDEVLVVK